MVVSHHRDNKGGLTFTLSWLENQAGRTSSGYTFSQGGLGW